MTVLTAGLRRPDWGPVLWVLTALLIALIEGGLIAIKPVAALAIPGILLLLLAAELPLAGLLALTFALRVMTDDTSGTTTRTAATINVAGGIAGLILLIAAGLVLRNQRALRPLAAIAAFIIIWTLIASANLGLSLTAWREGIRELSVLAVAVIVIECPWPFSLARAARIAQIIGLAPAFVVFYQLAYHLGQQVHANLRPNGTFSQPNSAGVFFAVVGLASIWLYFDHGRKTFDLLATLAFMAATVGTYSLGGLTTFFVMMIAFATARRSTFGTRFAFWTIAAMALIIFALTPVGASRLHTESSLNSAPGGGNSLTWRISNWKSLLPLYEHSPVVGQGLGVTVVRDTTNGALPHSEWVRYLVETGTVGMAIILSVVVIVVRRLWRVRRQHPAAAPFALALLVGLLFNGIGANTLLYTPAAYMAAMLLAAAWRSIMGVDDAPAVDHAIIGLEDAPAVEV